MRNNTKKSMLQLGDDISFGETSEDPTDAIKRTECYAESPSHFDVSPCECGNNDCNWSEWVGMLWCPTCEKDFVPESWGALDGPVPIEAAHLMGFCFDRIDLTDDSYLEFRKNEETGWGYFKLTNEEFRKRSHKF